ENLMVVPIPGPSALITALSASGLASDSFTFLGFLPSKKTARIKLLKSLLNRTETCIFYESPKRILATLTDLHSIFGDSREVCLAKELTKVFETIQTDSIPNLINYLTADENNQKGEFVILIAANDKIDIVEAETRLDSLLPILCAEMGASKAAKLAAKITGIDKKICYKKAIDL
ncbi:MAG: SAM-dependent methyltransferase, partial [Candidatus Marinimicrobia bacterium]|nr:SAM-dependent methyltransferase [Candidatus Neomarinimicrobiota bacterium]